MLPFQQPRSPLPPFLLSASVSVSCLCDAVVTCTAGFGYAINWLLTLPMWEAFGRPTFAAYLIHPALIRMVYYQRVQLFEFNPVEYSTYFVAFLTGAYVIGSVLFVLVEQPSAVFISALRGGRK